MGACALNRATCSLVRWAIHAIRAGTRPGKIARARRRGMPRESLDNGATSRVLVSPRCGETSIFALLSVLSVGCDKKGPECDSIRTVVDPAAEVFKKLGSLKGKETDEQNKLLSDVAKADDDAGAVMGEVSGRVSSCDGRDRQLGAGLRGGRRGLLGDDRGSGDGQKVVRRGEGAGRKSVKNLPASLCKFSVKRADKRRITPAPNAHRPSISLGGSVISLRTPMQSGSCTQEATTKFDARYPRFFGLRVVERHPMSWPSRGSPTVFFRSFVT